MVFTNYTLTDLIGIIDVKNWLDPYCELGG